MDLRIFGPELTRFADSLEQTVGHAESTSLEPRSGEALV